MKIDFDAGSHAASVEPLFRTASSHDETIQSLYPLAVEPNRWRQTVEELRSVVGASDKECFEPDMAAVHRRFMAARSNPIHGGQAASHSIGVPVLLGQDDTFKYRVEQDEWHAAVRVLANDPHTNPNLISHVPPAHQFAEVQTTGRTASPVEAVNDFNRGQPRRLTSLGLHLHRALRLTWRLDALGDEQELKQSAMDRLNQAILVLDGQYGILQANAAGQQLLDQGDAVIKLRGGCLAGLGDRLVPPLEEVFARADRGIAACLVYRFGKTSGPPATGIARLAPLSEQPLLGLPAMRARYLLVIEPPGRINPAALDAFGQLFRLTRAEQAVLTHLMEDATPQEIATALGVGLPTVRTHLRNLRQKTGVRRHTELVRLALAGMRTA